MAIECHYNPMPDTNGNHLYATAINVTNYSSLSFVYDAGYNDHWIRIWELGARIRMPGMADGGKSERTYLALADFKHSLSSNFQPLQFQPQSTFLAASRYEDDSGIIVTVATDPQRGCFLALQRPEAQYGDPIAKAAFHIPAAECPPVMRQIFSKLASALLKDNRLIPTYAAVPPRAALDFNLSFFMDHAL